MNACAARNGRRHVGAPPTRRPRRGLALVAPVVALLLSAPASSQDNRPGADVQAYDIPAQQLDSALTRYAATSGVDFLLDEPQVANRRSSAVIGTFTPPQALHILLQGTGLVARFTSRTSAVIMPVARAGEPIASAENPGRPVVALDMMRVTAPRLIASGRPPPNLHFISRVGAGIHDLVLAANLAERGPGGRLRIQTRIDGDGRLHDVQIARASADPQHDARIVALLEGARLDLIPPAGMGQPLLFDLVGK